MIHIRVGAFAVLVGCVAPEEPMTDDTADQWPEICESAFESLDACGGVFVTQAEYVQECLESLESARGVSAACVTATESLVECDAQSGCDPDVSEACEAEALADDPCD
jgi:hypothetical protein